MLETFGNCGWSHGFRILQPARPRPGTKYRQGFRLSLPHPIPAALQGSHHGATQTLVVCKRCMSCTGWMPVGCRDRSVGPTPACISNLLNLWFAQINILAHAKVAAKPGSFCIVPKKCCKYCLIVSMVKVKCKQVGQYIAQIQVCRYISRDAWNCAF